MKSTRSVSLLVLALAGTVTAAGCASSPGQIRVHPFASAPTPGSPVQAAQADAAAVIDAFGRMPSAVRLSGAPAGVTPMAMAAPTFGSYAQPVEAVGWYRVPVSDTEAMAEAEKAAPGWARGLAPGGAVSNRESDLEATSETKHFSGVIGTRQLNLLAYPLTDTTSAVQILITDGYRPAKLADERFPATGVLDVAETSAVYQAKPTASRKITDPAAIAHVAGILNALPTLPVSGPMSCPAITSQSQAKLHVIHLTFRATADGPALIDAQVIAAARPGSGYGVCDGEGTVAVTVGATGRQSLDASGQNLYARLAGLTGLPANG